MSVETLRFRKQEEYRRLREEVDSGESVIESLKESINRLKALPPQTQKYEIYQKTYEGLRTLITNAFDDWSRLDDTLEELENYMSRLQSFSD